MTRAKMKGQSPWEWVGGSWCQDTIQFASIQTASWPAWLHKGKRIGRRELQDREGPFGGWGGGGGCIPALVGIGKLKPGAGSECLSVLRLEPRPRAFCSLISLVSTGIFQLFLFGENKRPLTLNGCL